MKGDQEDVKFFTIRPKNAASLDLKNQPRCAVHAAQSDRFHVNPANQVNSDEGGPYCRQPAAALKHPISYTTPAGLKNV